jgi:poly-beta-1,6-N-acetyl-D-glucosamine synthase
MNYNDIYGSMRLIITVFASLVLLKYFVYLVIAPVYTVQKEVWKFKTTRKIKKGLLPKEYKPLVSVLIPAWNEEVGIITTIKSVLANTYQNIEIIVIDDGSTDNTKSIVKEFKKAYDLESKTYGLKKTLKFFSKKNGGKGSALNHGVKKSKGEIIVTMDADSAHHPDAVANIVKYFRDPGIDALVGNVKVSNTNTILGLLQKLEYLFGFYFKRVHSLFNAEYIYGGACAAFRKSTTFDSLGLFDTENKTEDIEYSMRTKLFGLKAVYGEDVVVFTEGASSLKGLYKQRLRWKKGRIDTFIKYKSLFFSRNPKHSKFMTFIILPFAVMGEFQLLLEPMFFALIWSYTLISGDFLSIGLSSLFILFTFVSAIFFGDKKVNVMYLIYFPAFWLIFYILVAIELLSLLKSVELVRANEDIAWQKWKREGISYSLDTLSLGTQL